LFFAQNVYILFKKYNVDKSRYIIKTYQCILLCTMWCMLFSYVFAL
jgi:hypothetical protein